MNENPTFQAEVERFRSDTSELSVDDMWRRLGRDERRQFVKRVYSEAVDEEIDIDDELSLIVDRATIFSNNVKLKTISDVERRGKTLQNSAAKISRAAHRVRCLYSGEDPEKEWTLDELQVRLDRLKMMGERRSVMDKEEDDDFEESGNWEADNSAGLEDARIGQGEDDEEAPGPIDGLEDWDERMNDL